MKMFACPLLYCCSFLLALSLSIFAFVLSIFSPFLLTFQLQPKQQLVNNYEQQNDNDVIPCMLSTQLNKKKPLTRTMNGNSERTK